MKKDNRELALSDIPLPGTELLEQQVIADAVDNPDAIGEVAAIVFPEYFSSDGRRLIWNTVVGMFNAGEPIDMASVWQRTGKAYIEEIQMKNLTPATHLGFLEHARLLSVANTKKRAYYAALTIVQQSASAQSSEEDIFAAADELSRKIKADGQTVGESPLNAVLDGVEEETKADEMEARKGRSVRIATSIPSLDKLLWGGWTRGNLIILAARPSVGKTAFMLQFAKAAAKSGRPVLLFSLEMTKSELGRRLLFSTDRVSQEEMNGRSVNWGNIESARKEIESLPIYINDEARTLQGILSRMTIAVNQDRCAIAMVDHLNLLRFDISSKATLAQQIGFATGEFKAAAKRLGIPIILLVQLNRDSVRDKRAPELQDLRDSGSIEQDADTVLMLEQNYEDAEAKERGDLPEVNVWLRKNRNYKKDVKIVTIPNSTYTKFTEKVNPSEQGRYTPFNDSFDEREDDLPY